MVCVSGVGWRVGTPAVGGLGTLTHLNEGDIMEERREGGCVRERQTNSVLFGAPSPQHQKQLKKSQR